MASNPKLLDFIRKTTEFPEQEWVQTGVHALDQILGHGIPIGKVLEIFGPEAGGKSLFGWTAARGFQDRGGVVILYDVEATAPRAWMKKLGVKEDLLIYRAKKHKIVKGSIVDRAYDSIEVIVNDLLGLIPEVRKLTHEPMLVIWDSIAATSSESEWEKIDGVWRTARTSAGEDRAYFANRARSLSIQMPKLINRLVENNATLIAINQLREKPGVLYGKKQDTPGGRALKYYSTIRAEISRKNVVEKDGKRTGVDIRVKIEKTKLTEPFREALLRLDWETGFDPYFGLLPVLETRGFVKAGKGPSQWLWEGKPVSTRNLPELLEKNAKLLSAWL